MEQENPDLNLLFLKLQLIVPTTSFIAWRQIYMAFWWDDRTLMQTP
jgi:hypothetical protein